MRRCIVKGMVGTRRPGAMGQVRPEQVMRETREIVEFRREDEVRAAEAIDRVSQVIARGDGHLEQL